MAGTTDPNLIEQFMAQLGTGLQRMANPAVGQQQQTGMGVSPSIPSVSPMASMSPSAPGAMQPQQQPQEAPGSQPWGMSNVPASEPSQMQPYGAPNLPPQQTGWRGAVGNAMLMASMIPGSNQPMSAGQNIAAVANAFTNLPYAREAHRYQMAGLPLQYQAAQAEVAKNRAQAEYYSGRNQAAIQSMYLRGVAAAQLRAQSGKVDAGLGVDPKTQKPMYGNYTYTYKEKEPGNPDTGYLDREFTPIMSPEDYGTYMRGQKPQPTGRAGLIGGLEGALLAGRTEPQQPDESPQQYQDRIAKFTNLHQLWLNDQVVKAGGTAGAGARAKQPVEQENTGYKDFLSENRKSAADLKDKLGKDPTRAEVNQYLKSQGKDPSSISYSDRQTAIGEMTSQKKAKAQDVDTKLSNWLNMTPAEQKKSGGFIQYYQGAGNPAPKTDGPAPSVKGPTDSKPAPRKVFNPDTGTIETR